MADAFAGPHAGSCIEPPGSLPAAELSPRRTPDGRSPGRRADSDVACGLLCDAIEYGQDGPIIAELPRIAALPGYVRFNSPFGVTHEGPSYPCTLELLSRLLTTDAGAVRATFAERLENPENMIRVYAMELLTDFLPGHAAVVPLRPPALFARLPDDIYQGASADGAACILLAHLYALARQELRRESRPTCRGERGSPRSSWTSIETRADGYRRRTASLVLCWVPWI